MTADAVSGAIARAARELPPEQVLRLAAALERAADAPCARGSGAVRAVPTARFGGVAGSVLDAWERGGTPPTGDGIATALRAASAAVVEERRTTRTEVVCTGPEAPGAPVRLTGAVLADVIGSARRRLLVVSFAAYRVPEVVAALRRALADGVRVDLVLETAQDSGGALGFDVAATFAELGQGLTVWHWPLERRPTLASGHAVLHAKALVADDAVALVTSANLTGHGSRHNLELGLLVHGGPVPRRIGGFFTGLMEAGELRML